MCACSVFSRPRYFAIASPPFRMRSCCFAGEVYVIFILLSNVQSAQTLLGAITNCAFSILFCFVLFVCFLIQVVFCKLPRNIGVVSKHLTCCLSVSLFKRLALCDSDNQNEPFLAWRLVLKTPQVNPALVIRSLLPLAKVLWRLCSLLAPVCFSGSVCGGKRWLSHRCYLSDYTRFIQVHVQNRL